MRVKGNLHIDLRVKQTRGVDSPKTRGLWPPVSTWRSCNKTSPFCPDRNGTGVTKTRDSSDDSSDHARRGVSTRNVSCSWNTVRERCTNRKIRRMRVPLPQIHSNVTQMRSSFGGDSDSMAVKVAGSGATTLRSRVLDT